MAHDLSPRVPASGHWVPGFSSGHECSPHVLRISGGESPEEDLPTARECLSFIRREERFFFFFLMLTEGQTIHLALDILIHLQFLKNNYK